MAKKRKDTAPSAHAPVETGAAVPDAGDDPPDTTAPITPAARGRSGRVPARPWNRGTVGVPRPPDDYDVGDEDDDDDDDVDDDDDDDVDDVDDVDVDDEDDVDDDDLGDEDDEDDDEDDVDDDDVDDDDEKPKAMPADDEDDGDKDAPPLTVPNDSPEVRGLLAGMLTDCAAGSALADYLMERDDPRGEYVRLLVVAPVLIPLCSLPAPWPPSGCSFNLRLRSYLRSVRAWLVPTSG